MSWWQVSSEDALPQPAVVVAPTAGPGLGSDVVVRQMREDDAEFVGRMVVEAFREKMEFAVGKEKIPQAIKANQEYLKLVSDRFHRFFVAEVNGQRAGTVQMKMAGDKFTEPDFDWGQYFGCCAGMSFACLACCIENPKAKHCYVELIAVDDGFRGKGIGRSLLERCDQEARNLGCTIIYLHVTMTNRARNLYERQGFQVIGKKDGCCCLYCSSGVRYFYEMEKRLE